MAFSVMARISELKEEARWCLRNNLDGDARKLEQRAFNLEKLIGLRREMRQERKAS